MNNFVLDIQPLAGEYRAVQETAPLFTMRTGGWRDDMMRDARPETNAFAPLLSLIRDIVTALESSRPYRVAAFANANSANPNDYVLCCREAEVALESSARVHLRGTKSLEVTAATDHTVAAPVQLERVLYFVLSRQKAICWFSSANSDLPHDRTGDSILLGNEQANLLLNMLIEEIMADRAGRLSISRYLLHALLLTVEREVSRSRTVQRWNENEVAERQESDDDPIDHARQYIESHLNQTLTIEGVARQVYMSRAQFAKRFREQTGRTFTDYVNDYRLRQAEKFLRETAWPIAHITEIVGFKSDSYFHRLFRREVGVSPMEYRRQHQAGGGDAR